jgi:hypothetical protein
LLAALIAFVVYVVVSTLLFGIVMAIWWAPPGNLSAQALRELAEQDISLLRWQNAIGTTLAIVVGYFASFLSRSTSFSPALVVGFLLVIYGGLSILLHPTHPTYMQLSKLLAPIPLTLLGGWLRLRFRLRIAADR